MAQYSDLFFAKYEVAQELEYAIKGLQETLASLEERYGKEVENKQIYNRIEKKLEIYQKLLLKIQEV